MKQTIHAEDIVTIPAPYPYNRFIELAHGDRLRIKDLPWLIMGLGIMPLMWLGEQIEKFCEIPLK